MKSKSLLIKILTLLLLVSVPFAVAKETEKGKKIVKKEQGKAGDAYRMFINNIDLPMNRDGVIADVIIGGRDGGRIDGGVFLFSGGFFVSGLNNGVVWSNAVASASRTQDYRPGVFDEPYGPNAVMYVLKSREGDFAASWNDWKDAVSLGAKFYDGDGDGVYNPIDLNSNGKWDRTEDRPDLIGDETVWCVYSDNVDPALRRFNDVDPQGIEIRQTVFAFASKGVTGNLVFVRYELTYNPVGIANAPEYLDSVYFSVWADPDLGDPYDDLVGCDLSLNSGFLYNEGPDTDPKFQSTPPACLIDFFQGPISFIPGVTFTDVNANGVYDEGTDTPLDTAYNVQGQVIGVDTIPGAMNAGLSSFSHYIQSDPTIGDPNNKTEVRNYIRGLARLGDTLNPCTWTLGNKGGSDCANVNRFFWYSGDPVTGTGWINTTPADQRMMNNTGPFRLEKNKPISIIAAYVAGRGNSALNSLTLAKSNDRTAQTLFNTNFPSPPPPPAFSITTQTGDDFIDISFPTHEQITYRAIDTVQLINRNVQGFYITQYRTNLAAPIVEGVENSKVIAHYERNDNIDSLFVLTPNGGVNLAYPTGIQLDTLVYGNPETGRMRIRLNSDLFVNGAFVKGKEYYYTITMYTVNHEAVEPAPALSAGAWIDSSMQAVQEFESPMLVVTFGENLYSPSNREALVQNQRPVSSGNIKYIVADQTALTGNQYKVEFFKDSLYVDSNPYWRLLNATSGAVLIDSSKRYYYDTTDYSGKVIDGFLVRIQPVEAQFDPTKVTHTGNKWFGEFNNTSSGVFYPGIEGTTTPIVRSTVTTGKSTATAGYDLRQVELRFDPAMPHKAYRYLNGYKGSALSRVSSYIWAGSIVAADTVGRGAVGRFGEGFVSVPFSAWVKDPKTGEEYQLATAFIEVSSNLNPLRGNPDGNWDPGINNNLTNEYIVVLNAPYDATGKQTIYTGEGVSTNTVYADIVRGWQGTLPASLALTPGQQKIAKSPWFNALYVVGLQKADASATWAAGDVLTIPVEKYEYTSQDQFVFNTTPGGTLTEDQKKNIFNSINVFPNPLFGYNPATSFNAGNPDEPFVTFSNLPEQVTVRIYTLSGTMVRTLTTADKSSPTSPFLRWDITNEDGLRCASGMYLATVECPGYGQKVLKFAIIMPQKQIQRF